MGGGGDANHVGHQETPRALLHGANEAHYGGECASACAPCRLAAAEVVVSVGAEVAELLSTPATSPVFESSRELLTASSSKAGSWSQAKRRPPIAPDPWLETRPEVRPARERHHPVSHPWDSGARWQTRGSAGTEDMVFEHLPYVVAPVAVELASVLRLPFASIADTPASRAAVAPHRQVPPSSEELETGGEHHVAVEAEKRMGLGSTRCRNVETEDATDARPAVSNHSRVGVHRLECLGRVARRRGECEGQPVVAVHRRLGLAEHAVCDGRGRGTAAARFRRAGHLGHLALLPWWVGSSAR